MNAAPSIPLMRPWPALAPFGGSIELGGRGAAIFRFDSRRGTDSEPEGAADEDPAFVLIHGLGDEADSWRHVFPLLSAEARVLAPDLPGFGRSPAKGRVTLGSCAAAVLDCMDRSGIRRAVLVGSSLGGVVAQLAVVRDRRPGRIAALGLVDGGLPSFGGSASILLGILPILGERHYRAYRGRPDAAYASLNPYYASLESLPHADREFLRERVTARVESDSQMRAYFSLFRSLVGWATFRPRLFSKALASFEGPVLVGWGSKDRIVPPAAAKTLAAAARRPTEILLEGSGHLPQQEAPEALARALIELRLGALRMNGTFKAESA